MFNELLNGKFFGHPVHLMLVHFPAAFFPLSAAIDIYAIVMNNVLYAEISFYILCLGIITGFAAAVFGTIDLLKLKQEKVFRTALIHGGLNLLWAASFSVIAGLQYQQFPEIRIPSLAIIVTKIICVFGMLYSNFLGGELVLKYGVGRKAE
jgi:uncharacterized membrane protein